MKKTAERIKEVRKSVLGLTRKGLAGEPDCVWSEHSIMSYEYNRNRPPLEYVSYLCKKANISSDYILLLSDKIKQIPDKELLEEIDDLIAYMEQSPKDILTVMFQELKKRVRG